MEKNVIRLLKADEIECRVSVINELLGRKNAELEKGANDENITTEN